MPSSASVFELSPGEYEQAVKAILDAAAGGVVAYSSRHLESIAGSDGDYIFDVTARFEALGVAFLVLVECKRYRRRVERQEVQVLWAKMQSVGAQKGMLFATAGFQQGAVEVAQAHGIALVRLAAGEPEFVSRDGDSGPASGAPAPTTGQALPAPGRDRWCGWWLGDDGLRRLAPDQPGNTRCALGLGGEGDGDYGTY